MLIMRSSSDFSRRKKFNRVANALLVTVDKLYQVLLGLYFPECFKIIFNLHPFYNDSILPEIKSV